jgi:hypothetical protein
MCLCRFVMPMRRSTSSALTARKLCETLASLEITVSGQRFVVHADEKLTAFMVLEAVIRLARPIRRQRVSEKPITLSGYIVHNL